MPNMRAKKGEQGFRVVPALERFWANVAKGEADECWAWTGGRYANGYGCFWDGSRKVRAHRFALEQHEGPIPPGHLACHRCDNPICVNPAHLFAGTQTQNLLDCSAKGRNAMQKWAGLVQVCVRAGHPLTPENVYERSDGRKQCRPCTRTRDSARSYRAERRVQEPKP